MAKEMVELKTKWWEKLKFWKKNEKAGIQKVKKIKVTVKDIQENCVRIKSAMDRTKVGTPEYEALQKELEHEEVIIRKMKDANQVICLKDAMIIGGSTVALIFFIALAREYPTALKTASTILKFVPFKG